MPNPQLFPGDHQPPPATSSRPAPLLAMDVNPQFPQWALIYPQAAPESRRGITVKL